MLNAVGLQNVGMEAWIRDELPALRSVPGLPIIANIVGKTVEEYAAVAARLSETDVDMIELNISCPNGLRAEGACPRSEAERGVGGGPGAGPPGRPIRGRFCGGRTSRPLAIIVIISVIIKIIRGLRTQ